MRYAGLRSSWANASLYQGRNTCAGLKPWLSADDFFIDRIPDDKNFVLSPRDMNLWKSAMTYDAVRFGINSLQTVHSIRTSAQFPKLGAWHLIQAYYASFYAAHSVLRLFGRPFTQLEAGHVDHIRRRGKTEGISVPASLSSGSYIGRYDPNLNIVEFSWRKESHRDLWSAFTSFLDDLSAQTLRARGMPRDLAELSGELQAIADLLRKQSKSPSGNWLSTIRNEINYRSPDEVWFPFTKNTPDSSEMFERVKAWRNNKLTALDCAGMPSKHEKFFSICLILVQLCKALMLDYSAVAPKACAAAPLLRRFIGLSEQTYEV